MNNKNNVIRKDNQIGFTLIEVMITVIILGIITSIAYPSYMKQVQKSKRTPAKVELMRIAQLQESFYVQNLSYAKTLNGASSAGGLGFPAATVTTEGGDYIVALTSTTSNGNPCTGTATTPCVVYTLIAIRNSSSPQVHDTACVAFKLTNTGAKDAISMTYQNYGNASVRKECW